MIPLGRKIPARVPTIPMAEVPRQARMVILNASSFPYHVVRVSLNPEYELSKVVTVAAESSNICRGRLFIVKIFPRGSAATAKTPRLTTVAPRKTIPVRLEVTVATLGAV
jgi:hypothetical protein